MYYQLIIAIILIILSVVLAPKPKTPKPPSVDDLENPVAEAGIPVTVIFGTITKKSPNILWFGDKSIQTYNVKA